MTGGLEEGFGDEQDKDKRGVDGLEDNSRQYVRGKKVLQACRSG